MKAKDRKNLVTAMQQWLQLKELTASQEAQMDALKGEILTYAIANKDDFTDGELALEGVGLLKWVNSPAKVAFAASGKALNEIETVGLIKELGEKYEKKALNLPRLKIAVDNQDRDVMAILQNYGVKVIQAQRLDVKGA